MQAAVRQAKISVFTLYSSLVTLSCSSYVLIENGMHDLLDNCFKMWFKNWNDTEHLLAFHFGSDILVLLIKNEVSPQALGFRAG